MKGNILHAAFNRGRVSRYSLARDDLQGNRIRYGAQQQTNWLPLVLGSMGLRPGFAFTGATRGNAKAIHVPLLYSSADTAIAEITSGFLRVKIDEEPIERGAVSTTVTNGDFSSGTGWTDIDEGSAASNITGGKLTLLGTGFSSAGRKRQVTVAAGDQGDEHALRIVVERGPVIFRCGSTDGGDEYVRETMLGTGEHSLAFTPTGNFWVQFTSLRQYTVIVDSVTVEAAGIMEIPTPWLEADLKLIRWERSEDVHWLWCKGYQQRKLERRGAGRSYSVVLYEPEDGPFRVINTGVTRLTPSAVNGDITLTASRKMFRAEHVGGLFQLTSIGQLVQAAISGEDQWSNPIKVIGVGVQRDFTIEITGTWAGTVRLQRSVDSPGSWVDVNGQSWTANIGATNYRDGQNNQIMYYRIGIKAGGYTSGTANVSLTYASGGITGVVRVTGYTNETSVSAVVLKALGGTDGTANWREGEWSALRGFPSAGVLDGGRLTHGGKSKFFGSVSDAYEGFDPDTEGDSGPINRSIPAGNSEDVNWMVSVERLLLGTPGGAIVLRSSTLDEPLTPTQFNAKKPDTRGAAAIPAVQLDTSAIYVGKSGRKLFEMKPATDGSSVDYSAADGDLTQVCPEIGRPGFTRVAAQRYPDTRLHCVRSDGTVGLVVKDPSEDVLCWIDVETDGLVEDVVVIPAEEGADEDSVYYLINRTIDGNTMRYLERWASQEDCMGGTLNEQADSYVIYEGEATNTISGLGHLEGREVIVWADGMDLSPLNASRAPKTYTVTDEEITLDPGVEVENAVIGLWYRARFRGTKLAYAAQLGSAIGQRKRVHQLSLVLADTHHKGLFIGGTFTRMDCLQQVIEGKPVVAGTIHEDLDLDMMEFPGDWSTDSRVCLEASAPRPCTVMGMVIGLTTNEKA